MEDVIAALRAQTANGQGHAWAKRYGFAYSFVYRVMNGTAAPSPRMCEALGFRKATVYERQP